MENVCVYLYIYIYIFRLKPVKWNWQNSPTKDSSFSAEKYFCVHPIIKAIERCNQTITKMQTIMFCYSW